MNRSSPLKFPPTHRPGVGEATLALIALLGSLVVLTGCTAPKYKAAAKGTLPPVLLNLPSTAPPIEALLHTVIVYRGPGAWKRDAYWDEYVVTVANRGETLISVDSAVLTGLQGQTAGIARNPWELEKTSRNLAEQSFGLAKNTAVQIGGGVGVLAVGGGVGAVVFSGGLVSSAGGAAIAGMFLLPAVIAGTVYTNVSSRHAIEREFERRLLVLPAELLPGQLVQGSLFFRITPGPQQLTLKCRVDGQSRDAVIDLAPLAGLHLKSPAAAPARTQLGR